MTATVPAVPDGSGGSGFTIPFAPKAGLGPSVGLDVQGDATGNGNGVYANIFNLQINSDDINQDDPGGSKVQGLCLIHNYGGSAMEGGRNSLVCYSTLTAPSNSSNADRNYVSIQGVWYGLGSDGGTPASPRGSGFGLSTLARVGAGGTGLLNVTGGDFELVVDPAAPAMIQTGIQVGGSIGANGSAVDAVVYLTCGSGWGFSPVGYRTGFWIGAEGGAPALASTGTVMKVRGHTTLGNAFDFTTTTFTGFLISTNSFSIYAPAGNHNISIGRQDGVASTPYMNWNSSGAAGVYDTRFLAGGGDGADGGGSMNIQVGQLAVNGQRTGITPLLVNAKVGQTTKIAVFSVNLVTKLSVDEAGLINTIAGNEATGGGSAALGANSPASTLTAPYTWLKFKTSDNSTVYVPAWK